MTSIQRWIALAFLLAIFGAGVGVGYLVFGTEVEKVEETPLPEVKQDDGSVVLERKPEGKPELPKPKTPGKPVRTVEVEVSGGKPVEVAPCVYECPKVRVRLDLVRLEDGTYRAIASSDTEVLAGQDIPLDHSYNLKRFKWAAGYARINGEHGAVIHRDIGRVRVGIGFTEEGSRAAEVLWRF